MSLFINYLLKKALRKIKIISEKPKAVVEKSGFPKENKRNVHR